MVPDLIDIDPCVPFRFLPSGIHDVSLSHIEAAFAYNAVRRRLFHGFTKVYENLSGAGCTDIYLDGSFVSSKESPGDFDGCWSFVGVDLSKVDPVLLQFANSRQAQKAKYGGEMFLCDPIIPGMQSFLEFFQTDKFSGQPKGIIRVVGR